MEQFKKKLNLRMRLFGFLVLFCIVIILINQFGTFITYTESLAFSFQRGFSAAGALVLVFWMMKYRGALRDETKLRLLYNEENGERMKAIRAKAGVPMVLILSLTLVLAGMDAFHPCAFFVLLFLLSLLVHAKSRTRMAIVGGTFVLFSGLVYFVFMAAWLNVFLIAGELRVITAIAGLVALTVAALGTGLPSLIIPRDSSYKVWGY